MRFNGITKKLYYEWTDFEQTITEFGELVRTHRNPHILTLYRGGLPLGVRLSNQYNLPLSILDYQSYDGDSKEVTMMKDAGIKPNETLYLVDDILDTGNTFKRVLDYLKDNFPKNKICVYAIFGDKHKYPEYNFWYHRNDNEWVVFEPWEGTE